jgi:hypothetical protein
VYAYGLAVAVKNTAGGVAASAGAAVTINRWSVNFCDDVGADAVECSYQCRWSWRCKRGWCFSTSCGSWSSASNRRLCLLESLRARPAVMVFILQLQRQRRLLLLLPHHLELQLEPQTLPALPTLRVQPRLSYFRLYPLSPYLLLPA